MDLGRGASMRRTRKLLLAGMVLGAGSISPALAADMPVKAPVAAPPFVSNWSGIYIGGHAGYGIGMSDWHSESLIFKPRDFLPAARSASISSQATSFSVSKPTHHGHASRATKRLSAVPSVALQ
jgi:opacity protein-like surface antigen